MDPDPHKNEKLKLAPDPHYFWKLDPDPHKSEKLKLDPDPHKSKKSEDLEAQTRAVDAQKWSPGGSINKIRVRIKVNTGSGSALI
jgi:hypothetical protein